MSVYRGMHSDTRQAVQILVDERSFVVFAVIWEGLSQQRPAFSLWVRSSLATTDCILPRAMDPSTSSSGSSEKEKPTVLITIGMAGSGKTTFVQRVNSYLRSVPPQSTKSPLSDTASTHLRAAHSDTSEAQSSAPSQEPRPPYILNLDPAVTYMPYDANIDIRDTIDYAEVMKQYANSSLQGVTGGDSAS